MSQYRFTSRRGRFGRGRPRRRGLLFHPPRALVAVVFFAIGGVWLVPGEEHIGTVLSATEGGTILRNGEILSLLPGAALQPQDTVTTSAEGRATLVLPTGETVALPPQSTVTIAPAQRGERRLGRLWGSVRRKFSAGDDTHAALGTLGAVLSAPEEPLLEDFSYLDGDEEAHGARVAEIGSLREDGAITEAEAALLEAIVAEEYGRYNTALTRYRTAMTSAGRRRLLSEAPDALPTDPRDTSIALLIADLYIANGYYNAAAAISDEFSLR